MGYDDGYNATPEELKKLDDLHERLGALKLAKAHLQAAEGWLQQEGLLVHGTLKDMVQQVDLALDCIRQDFLGMEE